MAVGVGWLLFKHLSKKKDGGCGCGCNDCDETIIAEDVAKKAQLFPDAVKRVFDDNMLLLPPAPEEFRRVEFSHLTADDLHLEK